MSRFRSSRGSETCYPSCVHVRRTDRGTIRLDDLARTGAGAVLVPAAVTRTGIFAYQQADGSEIRELRHPEEVLSPEALASLAHVPVTVDHPPDAVDASTWADVAVGHVAGSTKVEVGQAVDGSDSHHVKTVLVISDAATIARLSPDAGDDRLVEVSCGYYAELDMTPGEYGGQPYDAMQRRIRYNHVALGPIGWGRAGATVRVLVDRKDRDMSVIVDGKEYGEKDVRDLLAEKASMKDAIKERVKICDAATRLGLRVDEDASNLEAMTAMVAEKFPGLDLSGKSPDYVMGAFHVLLALAYAEPAEAATPDAEEEPKIPAEEAATPDAEGDYQEDPEDKPRADARKPAIVRISDVRRARSDRDDTTKDRLSTARAKLAQDLARAWKGQ